MELYFTELKNLRWGLVFSLVTLLYGFCLGAAFGAAEESMKGKLKADAEQVFESIYEKNTEKMKTTLDKSWTYMKRAHLHANGLGTTALTLILLLACYPSSRKIRAWIAIALGLGSFGYSVFWMFAGFRAPGLGSTSAAKETLEWLAVPSSGLCLLGLFAVFGLTIHAFFLSKTSKKKSA